jgi:hypothetical protein
MKYNVIVPFRGRRAYRKQCLKSLDIAAKGKDVVITLVTDEDHFTFDEDEHYDVPTTLFMLPQEDEQFNKSRLLNKGLRMMRQDFDYVSIVDCDMIYNPKFFDITNLGALDDVYFISGGYKLTGSGTSYLFNHYIPYNQIPGFCIDPTSVHENNNGLYPSQITLTKYLYHKLLDILQTKDLYHEGFIGWGGEDSYLSFFSRACERAGLLKRHYDKNMWYHLWHPPAKESEEFDEAQHQSIQ